MTKREREHPEILNGSRRARIARGAGVTVTDVNQLIKKFNETKKMMKKVMPQVNAMTGGKKGKKGRRRGSPGMPGGMGLAEMRQLQQMLEKGDFKG